MNLRDHFDRVIFDWAGTMVDFGSEAPVLALLEAYDAEGVTITAAAARQDMGKAKRDHVNGLMAIPEVASAWQARFGRPSNDGDVERIMVRLGPLMREHAERASTLIPGARATYDRLREMGMKIASSTGYTREMMAPVLAHAAEQGYRPDHVVCSGETPAGRPSPLMIYKACAELGVWPLSRVIKVDDAEAGIAEGKSAGAFTVGVASGNALGLSLNAFQGLSESERASRLAAARQALLDAGADIVVESVAMLIPALEMRGLAQA
jgi:phosphonoacetaldehyde hydrolase